MDHTSINPTGQARILIVDPNRSVAEALAHFLEAMERFTVKVARDAVEACAEIDASGGFELMLLDLDAPGLERAHAIKRLAGLNGGGKTVTITGSRVKPGQISIFDAGDVRLLHKTHPACKIADALSAVLKGHFEADP